MAVLCLQIPLLVYEYLTRPLVRMPEMGTPRQTYRQTYSTLKPYKSRPSHLHEILIVSIWMQSKACAWQLLACKNCAAICSATIEFQPDSS